MTCLTDMCVYLVCVDYFDYTKIEHRQLQSMLVLAYATRIFFRAGIKIFDTLEIFMKKPVDRKKRLFCYVFMML